MLARARALALSGPAAVLDELHPSLALAAAGHRALKTKDYEMHSRPLGCFAPCSVRTQ